LQLTSYPKMSHPIKYARTPLSVVCQFSLLVQGLGWIPSLGLVNGRLEAQAQTPSNAIDDLGSFEPAPAVTATSEPEYVPPQVEWEPNPAPAPEPYYAAEEQWQPAPEPEPYYAPQEQWQPAPEPEPEPYYAAEEQWQPAPEPEPYYAPQEQWQPAPEPEPYYAAEEQWQPAPEPEPYYAPQEQWQPAPEPEPYYAAEEQWEPAPAPMDYSNVYIDPNDYSIGATTPNEAIAQEDIYQEPSSVVLSERSTGCETVLQQGQAVAGGVCGAAAAVPPPPPPTNNWHPAPAPSNQGVEQYVYAQPQQQYQAPAPVQQYAPVRQTQQYAAPAPQEYLPPVPVQQYYGSAAPAAQSYQPYYNDPAPSYYNDPAPSSGGGMQPVQLGALSIGSNGIKYDVRKHAGELNRKRAARAYSRRGNGNTRMIFPLAIPSPVTSLFGWRTHPISGGRNFHAGIDFGAPMGTPVLAAYAGQVAISDWLGGYGLTVVLEHAEGTAETLYGHLSELLVKEGEEVKQGDVIGLVGSTGNSTGPHLHFELRELTREGWVALDPGTQLEYAMAELVGALEKPPSDLEVALSKAAKPLKKYAKSQFFDSLIMAGFQLPNQKLSSTQIAPDNEPNPVP
jgi:murein DD-endopeptidase MepM/ murein hydrolase activator NlpD